MIQLRFSKKLYLFSSIAPYSFAYLLFAWDGVDRVHALGQGAAGFHGALAVVVMMLLLLLLLLLLLVWWRQVRMMRLPGVVVEMRLSVVGCRHGHLLVSRCRCGGSQICRRRRCRRRRDRKGCGRDAAVDAAYADGSLLVAGAAPEAGEGRQDVAACRGHRGGRRRRLLLLLLSRRRRNRSRRGRHGRGR